MLRLSALHHVLPRLLLVAGLALACAGPPQAICAEEAGSVEAAPRIDAILVETKLLFGLSSADGNGVSDQEWTNFLNTELTPRFPDGLTVIAAYGQVKGEAHGAAAVVQENMRLVLIYHPDTPEAARRLAEIRKVYSERFRQWGVLQVSATVRAIL